MRRLLLTGLGWLVSLSALAQTTTDMTNTPPTQVQNAMGLTVTLPNYGAGTLDSVYNSFINAIGGINLSGYISGLFWALAGIALVWQLIQLMLRSGEIGDYLPDWCVGSFSPVSLGCLLRRVATSSK